MEPTVCRNRGEFIRLLDSDLFRGRAALEMHVARRHAADESFTLPGLCKIDRKPVDFKVDRLWGAQEIDGIWVPNWRERLECPDCGMNSRQRAISSFVAEDLNERAQSSRSTPCLYMMEQVTAMYRVFHERFEDIRCTGSEYLGDDFEEGKEHNGIRHENAERLSFADSSFDAVVSNEVFEHLNAPAEAIAEVARVLKPGGRLYFTIPFDASRQENTRRAEIVQEALIHYQPPVYHGNPMSDEGSLVFNDFGWDFIDEVCRSGFADCFANFFWSLENGHLGVADFFFVATKDSV